MTYRIEVFRDGVWIVFRSGLSAETADYYAGIVSRNSNALHRTVNESTGATTGGTVSAR